MEQTGYNVGLEPAPEGGYVAVVPAFPGCYSQGESAGEALSNAREAILLTIEDTRERDAIPDLARKLVRVASATDPRSAALEYNENRPDKFSAEQESLDWEGEGWS